ncbi:MAG: hypothetical protein LBD57_04300 [Endomicrobium sp.]|jgi:spore coat protein CotH|uniref:hypothetical protein n=1 Tax=Candidatus Endomicrobiellum cubanum TaxID=3242325 RepID=UPI002825F95C|nr:hypothetical protein [Endomicrobium sp.]
MKEKLDFLNKEISNRLNEYYRRHRGILKLEKNLIDTNVQIKDDSLILTLEIHINNLEETINNLSEEKLKHHVNSILYYNY